MINQTPLHENINMSILSLMPKSSRKIVDIGCMSGLLAREYKKFNSAAYYIGVDLVKEYVDLASKYCDATYCLNIEENIDQIFDEQNGIDCWVMGDVLEHLVDPWLLMQKIHNRSDVGTNFVICIPNFQHWSIQYKLLLGEIYYEDSGLLDKSHLRIFSRKTILSFLDRIGFKVKEIKVLSNSSPLNDPAFINLIRFAESKGYNKDLFVRESIAYQYTIRFEK